MYGACVLRGDNVIFTAFFIQRRCFTIKNTNGKEHEINEEIGFAADKKIRVISVERSEKEIAEQKEALKAIARDIVATDKKGEKAFYRNQSHCTCYGRRCEFASICLDYDPKLEYVEFKKKED